MIILKQDDKLLEKVKFIFGEDIVINAYFTTWKTDDCTEEDVSHRLEEAESHIYLDGNYLSMDNQEIIIEFYNQRKISFGNSEWGGIELLCLSSEKDIFYLENSGYSPPEGCDPSLKM